MVVRAKTKSITSISLKNEEVGIHCLPPFMSKRRLYERYCHESGHVVKLNNLGIYTKSDREDEEWIAGDDIIMNVVSWPKFLMQ
jgi:hypothetical protein